MQWVASPIWLLMVRCLRRRAADDICGLKFVTDDNKTKIAKSGALVPLTRLARSKDMRVQRNATGALLNMTHSGKLLVLHVGGTLIDTTVIKTRTDNNL